MNGSTSNEDEPITFVGIVPLTTTQPMRSAHCVSALWSLFMRHLSVSVSFCCQLGRCWRWFFILSFRNFSAVDFREMAEEAPELKRDSTMTVTAKVRERSKAREHRKIFNAKVPCNAIEWLFLFFLPQEGAQFLEEQGKVHEDAKTRAQQRELEESEEEDAASKLKRTSTMAATAQVRATVRKLFSFAFCRRFKIQKSRRLVPYVVHF